VTLMRLNPLIKYVLHLADNSLILGHRNSEWTGHGPILEQDIAISNIALDLIGQSRNLYQYAASLITDTYNRSNATEDSLAYLRDPQDFFNVCLTELPKGDWADTICRQYLISSYQFLQYEQLKKSNNEALASVAEKSLKEIAYHVSWSAEWVIRLGDGTAVSHAKMQASVNRVWSYVAELFIAADYENALADSIGCPIPEHLQSAWNARVTSVFDEATLQLPISSAGSEIYFGKEGNHTEHLTGLLREMQYMQRTYPGCEW
jgi:ring-1,2-phenylacetyl-CoA epoxidase subunit PaaC